MNSAAHRSGELFWTQASNDLGIDVIAPFEATLLDGTSLKVVALVKNFGARNGMLVASNYDSVKPYKQKIIDSGYGYAANVGHSAEQYDRTLMVDVLKDWGGLGQKIRGLPGAREPRLQAIEASRTQSMGHERWRVAVLLRRRIS